MNEWREYSLGEIYEFASGLSKSADQFGFGFEFLTFKDVFDNFFLPAKLSSLANTTEKERIRCSIKAGDVFLTRTSETQEELGMSSVALKDYPNATFNGFTKRLRPKEPGKVLPEYAGYYFRSPRFRAAVTSMSSITTRASLNNDMLAALKIVVPPIETQKLIAGVLKPIDDKIDLLHRQNATLEAMAETLFRQWFVESEYDRTVGDLVSVESGYAFKSKDFREMGSYRVLKIKNISNGLVDTTNTDFVDEEVGAKVQEKFKVVAGDILIAMTGAEIGKLGIVPGTNERLLLNQRVGLLRERYSGSGYLAYIQLKSEFGRDYIDNAATGSAQPNISAGAIQRCPFPDVSDAKLKNYSSQLSPVYAKLVFNLGQIRTLQAIRDALLPRLMSGEITIL